ncbi:MAG: hypothetical protein Q4E59_02325 [Bacteroidales bacterium]|nr:hypothetical protein [Bacteroidales bacterium]
MSGSLPYIVFSLSFEKRFRKKLYGFVYLVSAGKPFAEGGGALYDVVFSGHIFLDVLKGLAVLLAKIRSARKAFHHSEPIKEGLGYGLRQKFTFLHSSRAPRFPSAS